MMRFKHCLILILIFSISCNQHTPENSLVQFEKPFSEKKKAALNEAVSLFDSLIMATFPANYSLERSYQTFIYNFCNPDSNHDAIYKDTLTISKLHKIFKSSGLENEIILLPQAIELLENGICRKYVYKGRKGQIYEIHDTLLTPPTPNYIDPHNFDIYGFLKKKRQLFFFNVFGEYYEGLKSIEAYYPNFKSITAIKSYVSFEKSKFKNTGLYNFHMIACGMKHEGYDLSDPTIRRILLIEFLY